MVIFESLGALAFLCAEYRNKTFKRFKSIETIKNVFLSQNRATYGTRKHDPPTSWSWCHLIDPNLKQRSKISFLFVTPLLFLSSSMHHMIHLKNEIGQHQICHCLCHLLQGVFNVLSSRNFNFQSLIFSIE
jgi:hypothetical protein